MSTGTRRAALEGRFEIVRTLGEGGFGIVYEAIDRQRGLRVALKSLKALRRSALEGFKSEFRDLVDLTHPNLPLYFELFSSDGEWFFSMELVEGAPIDRWVRGAAEGKEELAEDCAPEASTTRTLGSTRASDARAAASIDAIEATEPATAFAGERLGPARFDEARLRQALAQLRGVVGFLHEQGYVHRDIKPSNIRVRDDGRLFLLDFGLVGRVGRSHGDVFAGTPAYAAPEQARGGGGPAADAYALGTLVFELITGTRPFAGSGMQAMLDKQTHAAPSVRSLVPECPADLAELVDAWLDREPARRPAVAREASLVAPDVFVGRRPELELLGAALDAVRAGDTRVVLIEAPSGLGKTSLVHRFLRSAEARAPSLTARIGRPSPRENVPFNAFDGMLAADEVWSRAPVPQRARLSLEADAARGPLVVWIDDLQWADEDSLALLLQLLRPPQLRPALFLLSRRPVDDRTPPLVLPCARQVIALAPLAAEEAAALARGVGAPEATSSAIAVRSGGHPFFIRELCRAGAERNADASLDDVLAARIDALREEARELIWLLAISQTPLGEEQLARAAGRSRGAVARELEILRRAQLVRLDPRSGVGHRTYHDRVREVAVRSLPLAKKRALHEALLAAFDDDPEGGTTNELSARLEHLIGAGRRDEAAQAARRAARVAAEAGAYARAAGLLDETLRLGVLDVAEERDVRLRRFRLLEEAHHATAAAEEAIRIAGQTADPDEAESWRMRAGRHFLAAGDLRRGRHVLAGILERAGLRMPRGEVETLFALAATRARTRAGGVFSVGVRRRAPDEAARREYELLRVVSDGFSMTDHVRGRYFQSRALRCAIAAGDPTLLAEAMLIDALYMGSSSAKARRAAERVIARALAPFSKSEVPARVRAWLAVVRATFEKHQRPTPACAERLREAAEGFRAIGGDGWVVGSVRLVRGHCLRVVGDLPELRRTVSELVEDAEERRDSFVVTTSHLGGLIVWLADDAPLAARQVLSQVRWPAETATFLIQHWLSVEAEVEIALYEGRAGDLFERLGSRSFLRLSLLKRLQSVRICCNYTLGRALLATIEAGRGGRAYVLELKYLIRSLRDEETGYGAIRATLLEAGLAATRGYRSRACARLREVERDAPGMELVLDPLVARYLRAQLEGDRAGVESAEAGLGRLGVRAPRRFVRVVAPGFEAMLPAVRDSSS